MTDFSEKANLLKDEGNDLFKQCKWKEAIDKFTEAIELIPTNEVFYSNRSGAYINISEFEKSLLDADKAIELKPDWSRGYQRKSMALYLLERYEEAEKTLQKGIELDSNNNQLQSMIKKIEIAQKIKSVAPKGAIAQIPIAYDTNQPHPILWSTLTLILDHYINNQVVGLWATSPASEMSLLTPDECIELTSFVAKAAKPRKVAVFTSAKYSSDRDEFVKHIKKNFEVGADVVILHLEDLKKRNDALIEELKNIRNLLGQEGALAIAESPKCNFEVAELRKLAESNVCLFYIDNSTDMAKFNNKIKDGIGVPNPCFRFYTGSTTFLVPSLTSGALGYAGEGASYMPNLYAWLCIHKDQPPGVSRPLHAFLSLSDPTMKHNLPLSLKIFLKFHNDFEGLEAVSRLQQNAVEGIEESLTRLHHLHEAFSFVEENLVEAEKREKKRDNSVIL